MLVDYALDHFSTDNVSVMVVRFQNPAKMKTEPTAAASPESISDSPKE